MIDVEKQYHELGAGSHLPALMACFAATDGPVLELGVGHFSTTILHELCVRSHRRLVSVENKPEWREWFKPWIFDIHEMVDNTPEIIAELSKQRWGVVFIDDSPSAERHLDVRAFLDAADYVLVHDAEGEDVMVPMRPEIEGVGQIMQTRYYPWTLVLSKNLAIPFIP